ncbi:hypothetical protein M2302_002204 [Micromonospora sp. A200]|uniref:hypothetical protein n=1 Tax=Micromonospora sp. A200 TaxID=2940568 RepID=UPI0024738021|nr:hypothetical protein [Micromonospora sp. A200]MDH6462029.1 hypothetical protein [Micromonospora sp. A200]
MKNPWLMVELPGKPGKKLVEAWESLDADYRAAFYPHLIGETSAEFLSDWLARKGHAVSASTIRTYRRSIRQSGV